MFIYTDDLLLISTNVSGLQTLIKCANHFITKQRLTELKCDNEMNYLGAILSTKYHTHQQQRMKGSHKAYYALQGNGMCANGLRPEVVSYL